MTDRECLDFIRKEYGAMIGGAALAWGHRPEVLAGIMCRESRGGTSPLLDVPGPGGRGDSGHGHGLMQIDDRSFPEFCETGPWKDPAANIDKGASCLFEKQAYVAARGNSFALTQAQVERAAIAGYNCGARRAIQAIAAHLDVDIYTAHGDYSRKVLEYAALYVSLEPEQVTRRPAPETEKRRSIFSSIMNFFRRS